MTPNRFKLKRKLGEGSFAVVIQAYDTRRKKDVAIKCIKDEFPSLQKALEDPEVQIFRCLPKHPNIVNLLEVLYKEETGKLSLVFEYMDWSLYDFMIESAEYEKLSKMDFKFMFYQITNGIGHLHAQGVFHRDIKPENILIDSKTLQVKIADFGCCKGIYNTKDLTEYISTRWYRPPECAILSGYYGKSMDIWAMACVFFEMYTGEPLFPGKSEVDQVSVIYSILGSPPEDLLHFFFKYDFNQNVDYREQVGCGLMQYFMMYYSKFEKFEYELVKLMKDMLHHDPKGRLSTNDILRSSFFGGLDVKQKYSQFCFQDEIAKANELFYKLLNRETMNREKALDVLKNSLNIFKSSSKMDRMASGIQKEQLEEKVVRSMSKRKTINEKIQIRKYFRKIGDDVIQLGKLGVSPQILQKLIQNESQKVAKKRPQRKDERPQRRKDKKGMERLTKKNNGAPNQEPTLLSIYQNNPMTKGPIRKPKNNHFPSFSSAQNLSILNLSSARESFLNIQNISKFDSGSKILQKSEHFQNPHNNKNLSTFKSLNNSQLKLKKFETEEIYTLNQDKITEFDDGDPDLNQSNSKLLDGNSSNGISLFGSKIQAPNEEENTVEGLTSIVKKDRKESTKFVSGESQKLLSISGQDKPSNAERKRNKDSEEGSDLPERIIDGDKSIFDKIDIMSNVFSEDKSHHGILENKRVSELFSFDQSEETLRKERGASEMRFMEKSNPRQMFQSSEMLDNQRKIFDETFEEYISKGQIALFSKQDSATIDNGMKNKSEHVLEKKSRAKKKQRAKENVILEDKEKNSKAKKLPSIKGKKSRIKNQSRTPLQALKNRSSYNYRNSKCKSIKASQQQKMSKIFMNVIKI